MRTSSRTARGGLAADDYFERKSRELIAPEEEIEAWELDAQDFDSLGAHQSFDTPGFE